MCRWRSVWFSELRDVLGMPTSEGVGHLRAGAGVFWRQLQRLGAIGQGRWIWTRSMHALEAAAGIELVDADDYPTAVGDAVGQDVVYVGRVRHGVDDTTELNLWLTSDNVRKGAALQRRAGGRVVDKRPTVKDTWRQFAK
jgi:aspartate-semialdehyde dehydrogenase